MAPVEVAEGLEGHQEFKCEVMEAHEGVSDRIGAIKEGVWEVYTLNRIVIHYQLLNHR